MEQGLNGSTEAMLAQQFPHTALAAPNPTASVAASLRPLNCRVPSDSTES